jgi:hypothetical protein
MALVGFVMMSICSNCCGESLILLKPTAGWSVTGKDDAKQLKHLAAGVGWEFSPNAETAAGLQRVGITMIRCINVDPLPGAFDKKGDYTVSEPNRLLSHLDTCRAIGANPHVIIATGLQPDLQLTTEDIPEAQRGLMGSQLKSAQFGPKDWGKFERYCQAYFTYVLVTKNFPQAEFEVGNEPEIGGAICQMPPKPQNGSRALYDAYFTMYKHVAAAAQRFEAEHPGMKVKLGGPALAWAFTFRFGAFNWAEQFLADCGKEHVKLDFVGVHFYGNISSLTGEYGAGYPSFVEMLKTTQVARDRYCPGVPIMMTEWGASYQTDNGASSAINGNHIGAAWSAAFLNCMLDSGVDSALYLVTTDLYQELPGGKRENTWGWPSFFVNPAVYGKSYPKAPYHVFDMIARLTGSRVEATRGGQTVNCFATADPVTKRITVIVWNYGYQIPEGPVGAEHADREAVTLRIREAAKFFGTPTVTMKRWLVSETTSNAHYLFQKGEKLDERATLQQVDNGAYAITDDLVDIGFAAPPSSVSFVEITAK